MPLSWARPLFGTVVATLMAATIGATIRATIDSPYLDILAQYRDGADDASVKAIEALSVLPNGHSQTEVFKELERIAFKLGVHDKAARVTRLQQETLADAWANVLPAAAVLHLETGYVLRERGDIDRAMGHLSTARAIVDWPSWTFVIRHRPEMAERHASLKRDVYLGIVWTLQSYRMLDQLQSHLERTRDLYPDDAMVKLAFGSLEELRGSSVEIARVPPPSIHMTVPVDSWRRQSQQARWDKAIDYFRAALKADPALTEARLRLGRVLRLRGKVKDARQELEAAVASASTETPAPPAAGPRMVVPYLGAMFLAETIELDGDAAGALKLYQDVARRWPECQSGLLALSRAYGARGEREASLEALRMLERDQAKRECIDPWWTYHLGQGWRFGPFIVELRARVKGRS